jgi:hypothetical protein
VIRVGVVAREEREVEGREGLAPSSRAERLRERNFCLSVEVGVEVLLDSGSWVVRIVDRD